MPVHDEHNQYSDHKERWSRVRAAVRGKDALLELPDVLPLRQSGDDVKQDQARREDYEARASYYNATGRTLRGLLGLVKSKPSTVNVPSNIEFISDNCNGAGVSLLQQAIKSASEVFQTGRSGLLVTYPQVDEQLTKKTKNEKGVFARVLKIKPEDIINWKTETFGSEIKLTLLVIKEMHEDPIDKFKSKQIEQYRVFELVDGKCQIELHRKQRDGFEIIGPFPVLDHSGKSFDTIPFQFIGAENNDHEIDDAPLYDIAETNIAHFRNSADFEEAAHLAKELTLVISGLSESWYENQLKGQINVGTMSALPLNEGADAKMLQSSETQMCERGMEQKENHMRSLGAQLVERGAAAKTATQADNEASAEHSILSLVCENVSNAYIKALGWVLLMEGGKGNIEFSLPKEFVTDRLDSNMLNAVISGWQAGAIPTSDKNERLRKTGVIDPEKSDDDIAEEIEGEAERFTSELSSDIDA